MNCDGIIYMCILLNIQLPIQVYYLMLDNAAGSVKLADSGVWEEVVASDGQR